MTTRIPNLLHLLLLLGFTFLSLLLSEALVLALHHSRPMLETLTDPRLQILATMLSYLLALAIALRAFPALWGRSFLSGISWSPVLPFSRRSVARLMLAGLVLGFVAQAVTTLLPTPKNDLPVEALFHNPALIWILVLFGTLLAPLFEEIVFRGFLLPGLAIVIDWMRLPRNLEALEVWRSSTSFSPRALVVSSLVTSVLFAMIHAPQLGYTWPAVSLLVVVSLILCVVRIRTRSVAASTLVHACYNFSVFLTLFFSTGGFRHLDRA